MNISIEGVEAKELEGLIDKIRGNQPVPVESAELSQLRQQVHQLATVVERLATTQQPQQVKVEYPVRQQLQLSPAPTQLYLPESPARFQAQPTPLPATELEPGIHVAPWIERWSPWISAAIIGVTIGVIALRSGILTPKPSTPSIPSATPKSNSSNLLRVPEPPPGKPGTPPPPPVLKLPAIPQVNP